MFKKKKLMAMTCSLALLAGCASYNASTLSMLNEQGAMVSEKSNEVLLTWKAFDSYDSKRYLGRDVIEEGYVPVQLTIINNSPDPMYLNPQNFSVPLASYKEVASKVRTSTGGRVAAWGVPGLFFWPLLIPAIVDGFGSANANETLDADYESKTIKEQVIYSRSTCNGVVFIPKKYLDQKIKMYVVNKKTDEKVNFSDISLVDVR